MATKTKKPALTSGSKWIPSSEATALFGVEDKFNSRVNGIARKNDPATYWASYQEDGQWLHDKKGVEAYVKRMELRHANAKSRSSGGAKATPRGGSKASAKNGKTVKGGVTQSPKAQKAAKAHAFYGNGKGKPVASKSARRA